MPRPPGLGQHPKALLFFTVWGAMGLGSEGSSGTLAQTSAVVLRTMHQSSLEEPWGFPAPATTPFLHLLYSAKCFSTAFHVPDTPRFANLEK